MSDEPARIRELIAERTQWPSVSVADWCGEYQP